jgi:hypothetical protein
MFWMSSVEDTLLTKFDFYLKSMIVSSVPLHKGWKTTEFNSLSLLKMQHLPCTESPHEPFKQLQTCNSDHSKNTIVMDSPSSVRPALMQ